MEGLSWPGAKNDFYFEKNCYLLFLSADFFKGIFSFEIGSMPPHAPTMATIAPAVSPDDAAGRTGAAKGLVGFVTHDSMRLHACLGACVVPFSF